MSSVFRFTLQQWALWAPNMGQTADWLKWAEVPPVLPKGELAPKLQSLEPMLRRRCSPLSRMSLEVAGRCLPERAPEAIPTVFASRNGESQTTIALLKMLAEEEVLSPMKFSLSVHNTSSGLFTIAHNNHLASTAVAAGRETFAYALLETATRLLQGKEESILLVFAEETLPEEFLCDQNEQEAPFAVALLLSRENGEAALNLPAIRMSIEPLSESQRDASLPQALRFIRWLLRPEEELIFDGRSIRWVFQKNSECDFCRVLKTENGAVAA